MKQKCGKVDGLTLDVSERRHGPWAVLAMIALIFGLGRVALAQQSEPIKGLLERVGDTSHLEFTGRKQWTYEIQRIDRTQIQMMVPELDTPTEVSLKTFSDDIVKKVQVERTGPDQKVKLIFTLSDSNVQSFDYLTDDPSRLIVDFYRQVPETQPKEVAKAQETVALPAKKRATKRSQQITSASSPRDYKKMGDAAVRKPAGTELMEDPAGAPTATASSDEAFSPFQVGVFDGNDPKFERFLLKDFQVRESAQIASRQNIYIPFPMLKMSTNLLNQLDENPPEYEIRTKDTKENKEARLILMLFEKGRFGLMFKAARYFLKVYPQSEYEEIIRHVMADSYYQLYRRSGERNDLDEARKLYSYLVQKYPRSPLSERTEIILAFLDHSQNDGLAILQSFTKFNQKYPKSDWRDAALKAMADGYLTLHKYDDALNLYGQIQQTAATPLEGVEAKFRIGDVYFSDKNFKQAEKAYREALQAHPGFESKFPNANFNMAEAQFWMGQYKDALVNYVAYLRNFPNGSHGGYAMTRVGEVLEILGADQRQVMGAYLESTFRYHGNPGAHVAFVRMTSQRMKGMSEKEVRKSVEEMDRIASSKELPNIDEFVNVMKADGFRRRGEYQHALDLLTHYYQEHPTTSNLELYRQRISGNIAEILKNHVDQGDFLKALQYEDRFSGSWLKKVYRLDVAYSMGRAFEQAGVLTEAEHRYSQLLLDLKKLKGSEEEKERKVFEDFPKFESVALRLAKVRAAQRRWAEAKDLISQIKAVEALSPPERVERTSLLADVAIERGDFVEAERALKNLIENWKDEAPMLLPAYQKMGEVQMDRRNYPEALKTLEKVVIAKENSAGVSDELWARNLQTRGDILMREGQELAACGVYQRLLDEFESKRPLSSIRYMMGQIFLRHGDFKSAERIWSGLQGPNSQIYQKLARERLANAKWQEDYKKYIQRIPAMTEKE